MDQNRSSFEVREGMDVIGSDGESIGSIDHFEGDDMVIKGGLFSGSHNIPVTAVTQADGNAAYLNVTKDAAMNGQWLMESGTGMDTGTMGTGMDTGTMDTGTMGSTTTESSAMYDQPVTDTMQTTQQNVQQSNVVRDDDIVVELAEEELSARTRQVERGEVRIEKDVIAEEQTLEVPVTEERVNVTRRAVDRDVTAGDSVFEGGTIEVPVHGEEVEIQKSAHIAEEVEISKDAVQEVERVTDTVRREEVHIDETGTTGGTTGTTDTTSSTTNQSNRRNS